ASPSSPTRRSPELATSTRKSRPRRRGATDACPRPLHPPRPLRAAARGAGAAVRLRAQRHQQPQRSLEPGEVGCRGEAAAAAGAPSAAGDAAVRDLRIRRAVVARSVQQRVQHREFQRRPAPGPEPAKGAAGGVSAGQPRHGRDDRRGQQPGGAGDGARQGDPPRAPGDVPGAERRARDRGARGRRRPGRADPGRRRWMDGKAGVDRAGRSMNAWGYRTMTVTNANRPRTVRAWPSRAALAGLAAGLLAALGSVHAATPAALALSAQSVAPAAVDPARQVPGTLSVTDIDFQRGDGGAGRLTLHFSGEGAMPDLQTSPTAVVVIVDNANLPPALARPLDVTDFATPVQRIDATRTGTGSRIVLSTRGGFEPMAYQTGSDYIVEVVPVQARQPVARADAERTVVAPSAVAQRTYTGSPVTFNFQDVPVRTVLKLIADEEDINLVASDTVSGNVTLRLENVPWDQALDIVLRAKGLDKRRNGNVIWVAPQPEIAKYEADLQAARLASENNAELVTEYIPVSYGSAQDIANLLTEGSKGGGGGAAGGNAVQSSGFLSARGSLSFDQRTNTLLVIDIPQRVAAIRDLVNQLDKPVDQVVIEARIVIANESFARELGARFGISGATGNPGDRSSVGFGG